MQEWYREDLAYIHDVGFADYALRSAPGILEILDRDVQTRGGFVVDLGCGSGLWAHELTKAHYRVLGIDISEEMIAIARGRVLDAEFRVGSLFEVDIPSCNAVTSIGEVLNYLFDPGNDRQALVRLFHRVYEALEQQVLVLRLLRAVLDSDEQLSVTIGSENTVAGIEACSLVTSAYGTGDATGSIGVIGPTRMDYLRAMAAVQAVARYLGDLLDDG